MARGEPPYRWPDGQHGRSWNTRFDAVGSHRVVVTDTNGDTAVAVVDVVADDELEVSPRYVAVPPGDVVNLAVVGGVAPYRWSAEAGSLSVDEGSEVILVAPKVRGEYAVTVTDGAGAMGVARIRVTAAMVDEPSCAPRCGKVESAFSIDGVDHGEELTVADEGADLDIGFRLRAPDEGERHEVYVAMVWSPPGEAPMTFFLTGDPARPLQPWSGGPFPSFDEASAGEESEVEVYRGGSAGLRGTFDFYVGFAPDGDVDRLTHNREPYRLMLE